ncbi:MAG TPA: efflux RND transporter permease subunit, partial [Ignavibacteria bacterium]|nr:efflux RND transporter permease subunit [Ignavibacteria bacterium]
ANAIQTNVVHINGKRQVYIPIYKRTGANTIASVEAVKGKLAELKERLPKSVNLSVILDQSVYVRHSINGLINEGIIGLVLISLALLLFLGNYRAMFIVFLSIPLSILFAIIGLFFTGDTINSITLGGIALVIGLLVDTSIVVLENIDKHLKKGESPQKAALEGTKEVALPVLVTAITIGIVFFPIIFLTGIAKYLFTPLAIVVVLAIVGSYIFSMTLVPIMAASLFKHNTEEDKESKPNFVKTFFVKFQKWINHITEVYSNSMDKVLRYRWRVLGSVAVLFVLSLFGFTKIGTELFPQMDVGQISIDVRFESGTRIEKTEETITEIEKFLQKEIGEDLNIIISNIGVLNDWPAAYTPNSGTQDATIAIQLKEGYKTTIKEYVQSLRTKLKEQFPGVQFIFNTGGIVTAALNFGLPSPIDIQIIGNDLYKAHEIAVKVRNIVNNIEGTEDVRIHQRYDHPEIKVDIDRVKASQLGISADDVVKNTVSALNSSVNFKPSFWIDEQNGNHYFVGVTYPEIELDNPQAVENISINGTNGEKTTLLKNIAKTNLSSAPIEVNHLDIQRVTDVFANVEGRDIGSVANEIEEKLATLREGLPEGYSINIRGEVQSMNDSFGNLGLGLMLAVLMVYLVIVPLLRSFKLPLIIITVIPLGLIGVTVILLSTNTYLNIQSMMGIIMMVGITVAYSNLLVDKMNNLLKEGKPLEQAIKEGAANRFRPIIMTAVVAVLALSPMAIGYETGGEANVPLARAIIGGVLAATMLSLFVVPILFYLLNKKSGNKMLSEAKSPLAGKLTFILFCFIFPLLIAGCGENPGSNQNSEHLSQNKSRNEPIVLVANPVNHQFNTSLQISGTTKPNQEVKLYAMTNGFLNRLNVDIGSFVKEGQTLAVLENPELLRDKEKLDAELKAKQSIYERLKNVYDKTPQLTTIAEVEKSEAEYESTRAQLDAVLLQISYLNIKAPFSGVITNRFVDKGAVIQSGLNNSNATPLFEIQDLQTIRLQVDIPETDAALIDKNTKAEITFPELPSAKYSAKVSRIAYGLNEATRTMKIEIDIQNNDLSQRDPFGKIRSGMYAKVEIQRSGHKDVLSVPNEAIGNIKGQSFVYVVKDGIVKKVDVKTGIQDDKFTELLTANCEASDKVVVRGKEFCFDGATVKVKEHSTALNQKN